MHCCARPAKILIVSNPQLPQDRAESAAAIFLTGTPVIVSLGNPREKFWGVMIELTANGIFVRGIDLNSFDDFVAMLKSGEVAAPATAFFPMLRIERVEIDEASGEIPALHQQFSSKAGRAFEAVFGVASRASQGSSG